MKYPKQIFTKRRMNKAFSKSFKYINHKLRNGAHIFGYHRIAPTDIYDPFELNVSTANFDEQIDIIKKYANPVSMNELVSGINNRKLPGNAVVITFDDGYSDNYYSARPVLEKYGVPATFFISAGDLEKEFWWDELERLTFLSASVPEEINIRTRDHKIQWSVENNKNGNNKISLFHYLYDIMYPLSNSSIEEILQQLRNVQKSGYVPARKYRRVNENELHDFAKNELFEIASHTVTHPNLGHISSDEQKNELYRSKVILENIIEKKVNGFSFPHGVFTADSSRILKETGYDYACLATDHFMSYKTDPFQLPRCWIPDWDG